ncbi:MAG: hypothetical protein KGH80_04480, partial [Xanthomonadaceae bacterium]|nr:hypothetical protein [Xanthomonadaceae bacterium]
HPLRQTTAAVLLVAIAVSVSPSALAQSAPGSITLACSAPASTGNTADLSTAAGTWGVNTGSGFVAANAASNGGWSTAAPVGNHWIGDGNTGSVGVVSYSVNVVASDPDIVLGSAKIDYSYFVDNSLSAIAWNGSALPSDGGSTTYNGSPYILPAPASVPLTTGSNTLLFTTNNGGGPYGLNANITLTFDCAPPVVSPTPANKPWTLWSIGVLILAAAATMTRRRRRKQNR